MNRTRSPASDRSHRPFGTDSCKWFWQSCGKATADHLNAIRISIVTGTWHHRRSATKTSPEGCRVR